MRSMYMGSALLLERNGSSVGPVQRVCFPNDVCQPLMFNIKYVSSRRNWLKVAIGDAGWGMGGPASAAFVVLASASWIASWTVCETPGAEGACSHSPRM